MNLKAFVFIIIFALPLMSQAGPASFKIENLDQLIFPVVSGDTVYIYGTIDNHIYDFFARSPEKLKSVKRVSLNSLGGHAEWAIEIGRKIRYLGLDTVVEKDNVCASACILLLGSGLSRSAHKSARLIIHGARFSQTVVSSIKASCTSRPLELPYHPRRELVFSTSLPGCVYEKWYKLAKDQTDASFDFLESLGVSPELRTVYFSSGIDKNWLDNGNLLKIKDGVLSANEALNFFLIHEILDPPNLSL